MASPVIHISELTGAQIRSFLYQVADGVSSYRSLHSLTQQVEHQYHGRFLIELLQNAHDAFDCVPKPEQPNRIKIIFDPADSEHGSLIVANDGEPFSASNFERLSQLGQSDKDPQKSIGNKGIGFRSVLEISERPEVYSRLSRASTCFDGYCFAFRPEVVQSLVAPIVALANDQTIPRSPIAECPIVDWSQDLLQKFRRRVLAQGIEWLAGECKYLSPYLLPVPLGKTQNSWIQMLAVAGFATVVRLPLKSADLQDLVRKKMQDLDSSTVLFLDKVSSLALHVVGEEEVVYTREASELTGSLDGAKVAIHDSAKGLCEYAVWSRKLDVASSSPEFRSAVSKLPGRWPEIKEITVSVAARLGDVPDAGRFSIFLPTLVTTGSAIHVNAPFFGDMSRTAISFEDAYNRHLLESAGELVVEVIRSQLAGKGPTEARAIIDMLSPFGGDTTASLKWLQLMDESAKRLSVSLDGDPLIRAEAGWRPLNNTSILPDTSKTTLLTEDLLRSHATFDIFHSCLSSRCAQLKALAKARYDTGAYPPDPDLAETIASIARDILATGGDWNAFWRDVIELLPKGQGVLAEHDVLLGGDGKLHSVGAGSKVFFVPRQGTQDDGDVGGEGGTTDVPLSLQPSVAFLSDQIHVYDPNKLTVQTPVRVYLGNGLVSKFQVDSIFRGVLQELTPALPIPIEGPNFDRCRDIMIWAFRLIGNVIARGRGAEATLRLLRTIRVPCQGGWFPMSDASFGDGWSETSGSTLSAYLGAMDTSSAQDAIKRLLLPPEHPAWGGVTDPKLLKLGGVFDGLRLYEINAEAWPSRFRASRYDFVLPPQAPPGLRKEFWAAYKNVVEAETELSFVSMKTYAVGSLYLFPGIDEAPSLSEELRISLCELVFQSLPQWSIGMEPLSINKQEGHADRRLVTSPLRHFLRTFPWLAIRDAKGVSWAKPLDRWHVPADVIAGRARHFAHLRALPSALAKRLDTHEPLSGLLHELGMPHFDLGYPTASPKLLEALAGSIGSNDVPDTNVLLGQLRDAWNCFRPPLDLPAMNQLVIRRQGKQLEVVVPTAAYPVFLPDFGGFVSELEQFGLPILTIYTDDAKRLKDWFSKAYGDRVQLTSMLSLVPQVNGSPWTGVSSEPLADSVLGWLIRPLLALVAFYGQLRGIHSAAFQDRLEVLRQTHIDWVPSAEVVVMRGEDVLMTTPVKALWDGERKTIIATNHCRENPADLSAVIAQALKRDDLELPIRVVLGRLKSVEDEPENISGLLDQLRISAEQVRQVVEHLRGDVGHMGRLMHVLFAVIDPGFDNAKFLEVKTEDELASLLVSADTGELDSQKALRFARDSRDIFDFGRSMWRELGDKADLSRWNSILSVLGQPRLANKNWSSQLQAGLEEAAGLMKRLMAHLIRQGSTMSFSVMLASYEGVSRAVDLSGSHWEVNFRACMGIVADKVQSWQGGERLATTVRDATSAENLRTRLSSAGVQLDLDPDDCSRRNSQLVDSVAEGIEKLRLAWWMKSVAKEKHGDWKNEADEYRRAAASQLQSVSFTRIWSEVEVFKMLLRSEQHIGYPDFWAAMATSSDLDSLQKALHVSNEELASVDSNLAVMRTESQRLRNIVKVCGEEFDGSEENRKQLWDFLQRRVPFETISSVQPMDIGKAAVLLPVKPARVRDSKNNLLPHAKKQPRQTKAVDELVGLAGEIFVFKMLQLRYGSEVVSSSSWVSENSKFVFPHNLADDRRGYDFTFSVRGKLHRIEVKSSSGDDESFTIGSSEIALAMSLATKKRGRRERFLLIHVKNALSAAPQAVILPNPYSPPSAGMFSIEEADARVRYRPKSD